MSQQGQGPPSSTLRTMEGGSNLAAGSWLLVAGAGQVFTHALPQTGAIVIGRAPECDVVIEHPKLSRRHVQLTLGEPPILEDLGSTNGTYKGGRALANGEKVPLLVGESFRVGPFSFVLVRSRQQGESAPSGGATGPILTVTDPTPEGAPEAVQHLAPTDLSVLILGETGVGKERMAETVHALSERKGPLLRLNCAALSPSLLESELFGHEKGAFTGAVTTKPGLLESATGGSVFLDEVGEMPLEMQAKLLRALEVREIMRVGGRQPIALDVRFIAATNRELDAMVLRQEFRADLYYRLNGVTLLIPPLRHRRGMIAQLALKFLAATKPPGTPAPQISPNALSLLASYDWPGNVRELKAVIERAAALARGGDVRSKHLSLGSGLLPGKQDPRSTFFTGKGTMPPPDEATGAPPRSSQPVVSAEAMANAEAAVAGLSPQEILERARIIEALEQCAGNQTRAAQKLGISRATLVNKLAIYRIPRPRKS